MSNLDKSDVKHVANLAQLNLTEKEVEKYQEQLSKVISYVDELSEVDTLDVDPTSQTTGLENVTREDKKDEPLEMTVEEALSGTDKTKNGYFVVPGVLTERGDV